MNKERIEQIARELYEDESKDLYTIHQAITQAVNEALEDAAKACEGNTEGFAALSVWDESSIACAAAIRRLKV